MYFIYAQDWSNGETSLHRTIGDRNTFAQERGEVPVSEARNVSADQPLLDKLTGNSGVIWAS